jgi:GNAT superfamily N-acetyltransferase
MSDLFVLPRARRRGAGRALADALADATRAYGLPGYITSASDSDPAVVTVAERLGFAVVGHHHESLLDLDALDLDTATAAVRRAEDAGYRLELIPEEAGEEAWQRAYALCIELFRDAPDAEGATDELPYSVFRGFFPDGSYVLLAWRDGEPVGFTSVMDRAKDDALNTFFTGVTRRARGSGLSTALKAAHALHMRARGHHRLYTQNMDQNAPILAANDRLGFRVDSGFYDLARTVTGD